MDLVVSSTPYLPSHGGIIWELLLLQFLNQLRTHHNTTTQHTVKAVQQCVESLKQEERRRKQLISQHEDDSSKLSADYLSLQNLHLSTGKHVEDLQETLKEYEEKMSALERQVEKENSARMVCERDATLQKALEQMNRELHEIRNRSLSDDGKINEVLTTLQLISQNQNSGKDIYILNNQLSIANEKIQNSTEMYRSQSMELQEEKKKTQALEEGNLQLEAYVRKLQNQQQERNQMFEAQLQGKTQELQKRDEELKTKDEEMKKKDQQLKNKEEELKKKEEELENKDNKLIDGKARNIELQKMLIESRKNQGCSEKEKAELLEVETSNCSTQLLKQKTQSESKLQLQEKKTQEAEHQLKNCNQDLNSAKEQTVKATKKHIRKAMEFTNQYRKYMASGNLNFAIAVYGDTEIKDIFRTSENIFGKQMTDQEAHKEGFSCGNDRFIPKCFKCDGRDDCGNRNDEHNCSTTMFPLGSRVVRGPDWKWDNQDGEPPGLGTVVDENYPGYGGWLTVKWDNGHKNGYRIGAEDKIDLRAAAGFFCGAT